jgi:hypothetical protein
MDGAEEDSVRRVECSLKDAKPQSRNLPHLPGHAAGPGPSKKYLKSFRSQSAPSLGQQEKLRLCGFAALREIQIKPVQRTLLRALSNLLQDYRPAV